MTDVADGEPRAAFSRRIVNAIQDVWVVPMLIAAVGIVQVSLFVRAVQVLFPVHKQAFGVFFEAAAVCASCMLPTFLLWALVNVMRRAQAMVGRYAFRPVDDSHVATAARDAADRAWNNETAQLQRSAERILQYSTVYGAIVTLALTAVVLVAIRPLLGIGWDADQRHRIAAAYACGAATVLAFARDFVRLLIRAATRDGNARMFAYATKRLVVADTGALVLLLLALSTGERDKIIAAPFWWLVFGSAAALLGDRVFDMVSERLSVLVGAQKPNRKPADDLESIEGLDEDDRIRLEEENITSVHGLALASTPRLFYNTKYGLLRICDWQDQALLNVRVGAAKARLLREQFGIRCATQLQKLAAAYVSSTPAEPNGGTDSWGQLLSAIGLTGPGPFVRISLEAIAKDEVAARLDAFRHAVPQGGPA